MYRKRVIYFYLKNKLILPCRTLLKLYKYRYLNLRRLSILKSFKNQNVKSSAQKEKMGARMLGESLFACIIHI